MVVIGGEREMKVVVGEKRRMKTVVRSRRGRNIVGKWKKSRMVVVGKSRVVAGELILFFTLAFRKAICCSRDRF